MQAKEEQTYQALLAEISSLYESTMIMGVTARRQHKVRVFWEMGRRLAQVGKGRSTYGERVLQRLAADLTERYGAGFKGRTVRYILDFGRAYSAVDLKDGLSWNHYKILMSVEDLDVRAAPQKGRTELAKLVVDDFGAKSPFLDVGFYCMVPVLTYGLDMYGRWVGDLFCNSGEQFLNRAIIENGLARYVDMGL